MSQQNDLTKAWDIEARQHEKRVYFNKPQLMAQYIGAKTTVIVAGRRTGKTDSIASPFVLRNMQRMPGSTGGMDYWQLGSAGAISTASTTWLAVSRQSHSASRLLSLLTMSTSLRSIMALLRSSSLRTARVLRTH